MKQLVFIILLLFLVSCNPTYIIIGYEQSSYDSIKYVYVLKRVKFPKLNKYVPADKPCKCLITGEHIKLKRENDSLIPIKQN